MDTGLDTITGGKIERLQPWPEKETRRKIRGDRLFLKMFYHKAMNKGN
jgi:hypothetical protein